MDLKVILSVFMLIISFHGIFGQSDFINSTYYNGYRYQSNLKINNTRGLNNFTDIPGNHLNNKTDDDVKALNCNSNIKSKNIPSIICQKFSNLESIRIEYMGIERIDEFSFKDCENLMILYLQDNLITTIHEKAFIKNLKLTSLDLAWNKISTLPENLFLNQQSLKELKLYVNKLIDLPENIFQSLANLTSLYLGSNQLQTIKSKWFDNLQMLTRLEMQNLNLTSELPRNLFGSIKNINYIGLSSNSLRVIHADTFGILLNAPQINLAGNKIYAIDEKFIDNVGPYYLEMENNICASGSLKDNTISRRHMKAALKDCFEFYEILHKSSTTTGPPNSTTEIVSTTSSSEINTRVDEKIQTIEDEVRNLIKTNEEMTANWKNQEVTNAENKKEIAKLQTLASDFRNEIQHFKELFNELKSKIEGGLKEKNPSPKNVGNNFVSINFDGEYQNHEKKLN